MKRIISFTLFLILIYYVVYSAFSFTIDGKDSGVEWDGSSVYKLVDGETNCGVNFGLVKVKFDYESNAVCLCFQFIDPDLTPDNQSAGVFLTVDNSESFEIVASDISSSENIASYSFDGAIYLDENNGATCEIRIGIKSGLPETVDFDARFIDSNGYYSNFYHFIIVNENYETTNPTIIHPTADNNDPAYNPDLITVLTEKTTRYRTTKAQTTRKTTTKKSTTHTSKSTTLLYDSYIKTSPSYSKNKRKTTTKVLKSETVPKTSKVDKSDKVIEKVYYYEKEIYVSEVYVTNIVSSSSTSVDNSLTVSNTSSDTNINTYTTTSPISLSKGTKIKKLIAVIGLAVFILIACFGTFSARKAKKSTYPKD